MTDTSNTEPDFFDIVGQEQGSVTVDGIKVWFDSTWHIGLEIVGEDLIDHSIEREYTPDDLRYMLKQAVESSLVLYDEFSVYPFIGPLPDNALNDIACAFRIIFMR
jgi:hypothetical protein